MSRGVCAAMLRWACAGEFGDTEHAFRQWRAQASSAALERRNQKELADRKKAWEDLLSDERHRHDELQRDRRTAAERQQARARSTVNFALLKWERGDDTGLLLQILHSWTGATKEARGLSRRRQAVHLAVLKLLRGDDSALLHACALSWKISAERSKQTTFGEQRIASERAKWEAFLSAQRTQQSFELNSFVSASNRKRARAHEATTLMLRQWLRGQTEGLLATVLTDWRKVVAAEAEAKVRQQSVRVAVLRFCEGDAKADVHVCLMQWSHWAKVERLYKGDAQDRARRLSQLEDRAQALVSRAEVRLLKYARMLGSCDDPMLEIMILAAWRTAALGSRTNEATRQLEIALEELRRLHDLAVTRRRHVAASTLRLLGCRDASLLVLDCLQAWSYHRQHEKQEWVHKMTHSKLINKYCALLLPQLVHKQDKSALVATAFWALIRNARSERQARIREEIEAEAVDKETLLQTIQEERDNLNDQLQMAYRQVDMITETLQKECKTKEDLTSELREVNEKLRKQSSQIRTTVTTRTSISSSRVSPSGSGRLSTDVPPHLPGEVLGAPGGRGITLSRPLVEE